MSTLAFQDGNTIILGYSRSGGTTFILYLPASLPHPDFREGLAGPPSEGACGSAMSKTSYACDVYVLPDSQQYSMKCTQEIKLV